MKLCTVCGTLTSGAGSRCSKHPEKSGANHPVHASREHQALRKRVISRWVGEHGWVCPGYQRPEHPVASDGLTLDHVVPLKAGGSPFDPRNSAVLCRSCNSTKGASTVPAESLSEHGLTRGRCVG